MRLRRWSSLVLVLAGLLLTPTSGAAESPTGFEVAPTFQPFYSQSGGLPIFGYALSAETTQNGLPVQYFERQRLEYHAELAGTPYAILLGRLGASDAAQRGLLGTAAFQPVQAASDGSCDFFPTTGHRMCLGFRDYWRAHGVDLGSASTAYQRSLALFGYPISEEFVDPGSGLTTQYFERAVFEYHPDLQAAGTPVLLAAIGRRAMSQGLMSFGGPAGSTSGALTSGVYIPGAAQDIALLDQFENMTGHKEGIVQWYQPWGADYSNGTWYQPTLDTAALSNVAATGAVPMITWEAWGTVNGQNASQLSLIPTGVFDSYIDSWARGLAAFGKPVYLRLFHEMNNSSYPWAVGQNGNTAESEIAAWRYVHDRFIRAGATNVRWVWSPNTVNSLVSFAAIYPGGNYVDWFGVDGYNGGSQLWGLGWRTPSDVFDASLRAFAGLDASKPIMIAETSTVEAGGSKADWIRQLFALPATYPMVQAIAWFDADLTVRGQSDWRVNTSDAALQAYRSSVK